MTAEEMLRRARERWPKLMEALRQSELEKRK
jgi:hypothetical protein